MSARDIGPLMTNAYREGVLSEKSMNALTSVPEIGEQISAGLGSVAEADFLVTIMPDDSLSIKTGAMQEAVQAGHNQVLDVARSQAGSCLLHTRYLNGHVLNPYGPAEDATPMSSLNYELSPAGTPLYDQSVVLLGTVLAKWREAPAGSRPRTITVIISDGADTTSRNCLPSSVNAIVSDMRLSGDHIVAAIGIRDGTTDFRKIFGDMGILDAWILTPDASADTIAKAFRTIAAALQAGAQSEAAFRQLMAGPLTD